MTLAQDYSKLTQWLTEAAQRQASDLHIVAGYRPTIRLNGVLEFVDDNVLTADDTKELLLPICSEENLHELKTAKNLDFAPTIDVTGSAKPQRFRANYFYSNTTLAGCFRVIPNSIPDLSWANFPLNLAQELAHFRNGLVLLTGITGSGKSTTLAMIVDLLVQEGGHRIITIEDPIEYLFESRSDSIVTQRAVGQDVLNFSDGLRAGLRQDPDVILVGEIRDRETAQMALSAAETGHLVFSTLHTRDAKGAISRFTDLFPQSIQSEMRTQLSMSLRAIVAQHLLPSCILGEKRELALEIMFNSSPNRAAIKTGKLESIDNNILTGRSMGMMLLDESIRKLLTESRITRETAELFVSDPRSLTR